MKVTKKGNSIMKIKKKKKKVENYLGHSSCKDFKLI